MEATAYEPKGRTHSNIPTFCWLWATSGNNKTSAEAQQNTNGWWWKAAPEKGRGAGVMLVVWTCVHDQHKNRSNTKSRGSLPTLQGFIWQKGRWIWQFAMVSSSSVKPGKELRDKNVWSVVPSSAIASGDALIYRERKRTCGSSIGWAKPHRSARATMPGIKDTTLGVRSQ